MTPFTRSISAPNEATVATGGKYFFVLDVENRCRTGKLWNEKGEIVWHYAPRRNHLGYTLGNPFKKYDFVVFDNNELPTVAIRRTSFVPSRFDILADDLVVGQIAMASPLLNRYRIDIDGLPTCDFRMPLFTVYFYGRCNDDTRVWVVVGPSKMQWNVLTESALNDVRLLAALAFIHNQWYNYC